MLVSHYVVKVKKYSMFIKRLCAVLIISFLWLLLIEMILNISDLKAESWLNSFVTFLGSCVGVFGGYISSKFIDKDKNEENGKQVLMLIAYLLDDEIKINKKIFISNYFDKKATDADLEVKSLCKFQTNEWDIIKREIIKYKDLCSNMKVLELFILYGAIEEVNSAFNTGIKIDCLRKKKILDNIDKKLQSAESFITTEIKQKNDN